MSIHRSPHLHIFTPTLNMRNFPFILEYLIEGTHVTALEQKSAKLLDFENK